MKEGEKNNRGKSPLLTSYFDTFFKERETERTTIGRGLPFKDLHKRLDSLRKTQLKEKMRKAAREREMLLSFLSQISKRARGLRVIERNVKLFL